jgi:hypothetical protein
MSEQTIVTCVYCGMAYPPGTPTAGAKALTDHIATCTAHPMSAVVAERDRMRAALEGLIGAYDTTTLRAMEVAIRTIAAPAKDKAASLDAIHALLAWHERAGLPGDAGSFKREG